MQNPRLASRYAKSLIDLAEEQNQTDVVLNDMTYLNALCEQSREFELALTSPNLQADKKKKVMEAVIGQRFSVLSMNFVNLLINKHREMFLPEIAKAFITQYNKLRKIKTVTITTATKASPELLEILNRRLNEVMPGYTNQLTTAVNPELLGGFVLEMDDKLVDASIRKDLNDVKLQFLKNDFIQKIR